MKVRLLAVAALAAPIVAQAGAPQPTKPVPLSLYSGRWYEVARTSNAQERGCRTASSEFSGMASGAFKVVETCQKANGSKITRAGAKLIPGSNNAKFKMSFMGGIVRQEYWILDTAPGGAWAIMATPGGNYVWLLSRSATLGSTEKATAMNRAKALGYSAAKLQSN